jgi:hypothetical protein
MINVEPNMRSTLFLLLLSSLILHHPSFLIADGGAVRLSEQHVKYQITVLTAPTPMRAGPIDVSVLVQKAVNNELVLDGQVTITATRRAYPSQVISHVALAKAATNKFFRAANFELPKPGLWDVEVSVDGPLGDANVGFEMEAAEPLPKWLAMWPWYSWPALIIILFGANQLAIKSTRDLRLSRRGFLAKSIPQ